MEESIIIAMVTGLLGLLCIIIAVAIVDYVLGSMALMEIGKRKGDNTSWLAWIPYAREYYFGKIAYENNKGAVTFLLINVFLPYVLAFMSSMFALMLTIIDMEIAGEMFRIGVTILEIIGLNIYRTIVANRIFKQFKSNTTGYVILSILVPCALEIILFNLRKKEFIIEGKTVNQ